MRGGRIAAIAAATMLVALPAPAADVQVKAKDIYFTPTPRIITVGDTVTWLNDGDLGHTVTSFPGAPASFDSSPDSDVCDDGNPLTQERCIEPGETFEFTFTKAGIYHYRCKPHGSADAQPDPSKPDDGQPCAMCGTIDVREADTPDPTDIPTLVRTRTPDPSESPSASVSPSVSPTGTGTTEPSDEPTDSSSPVAAPKGAGGSGRALVALLAIAMLSGAGFLTWRRFLATR